jgi:hypothetical protein
LQVIVVLGHRHSPPKEFLVLCVPINKSNHRSAVWIHA